MIGRAAQAPCGHPGEVVIGTFVRCLQGCDDKPKAAAPAKTDDQGYTSRRDWGAKIAAQQTRGLDAAERARFDSEMVLVRKVAEKAAAQAELQACVCLPFDNQCALGAMAYTYLQNGRQLVTPVQSLGVAYEYSVPEIRAAQVAGIPLETRKVMASARAIVNGWADTVMNSFLHGAPAAARGAQHTWRGRATQAVHDIAEAVQHFDRRMYVRSNQTVLSVLLPPPAFNEIACARMPNFASSTVLDYVRGLGSIKSIEPSVRLKTHMVVAWIDAQWMEAVVPIKFHQGKPQEVVGSGRHVTGYRIYCAAQRADDVVLRNTDAVHYTTGIWV